MKWVKEKSENPYSQLRRGIIEGCNYLKTLSDRELQFNKFIKKEEKEPLAAKVAEKRAEAHPSKDKTVRDTEKARRNYPNINIKAKGRNDAKSISATRGLSNPTAPGRTLNRACAIEPSSFGFGFGFGFRSFYSELRHGE